MLTKIEMRLIRYEKPSKLKGKRIGVMLGRKQTEYQKQSISGKNNPNWKGGKSFELYGLDWNIYLKTKIRKRDRFICQVCGKNGWIVHHIDYNKKNNNENNLITLCPRCHGRVGWERDDWILYFKQKLEGKI